MNYIPSGNVLLLLMKRMIHASKKLPLYKKLGSEVLNLDYFDFAKLKIK